MNGHSSRSGRKWSINRRCLADVASDQCARAMLTLARAGNNRSATLRARLCVGERATTHSRCTLGASSAASSVWLARAVKRVSRTRPGPGRRCAAPGWSRRVRCRHFPRLARDGSCRWRCVAPRWTARAAVRRRSSRPHEPKFPLPGIAVQATCAPMGAAQPGRDYAPDRTPSALCTIAAHA